MKLILEFADNLILNLMEDPKDRKFIEHIYAVKDRCMQENERDVGVAA